MKKLLAAFVCLLAFAAPAHAQETKSALISEINTNWPDNTTGAITPALLRSTVIDIVNSYFDFAGASSVACATHQFVTAFPSLSTTTCAQPAYGDISGLGSMAEQSAGSVAITGGTITGLPSPTNPSDAATKSYVDGSAAGLVVHSPVAYATAAVLPNSPTYNNTAGTLTAGSDAALVVDGQTVSTLGTRVLVQTQASGFQNGCYTLTTAGSGSVAWVLTRCTDFNTVAAGNIATSAYFLVDVGGTANAAGNSYVMTTSGTITLGSTALVFTQFALASGVASIGGVNGAVLLGTGLSITGQTLSGTTIGGLTGAVLLGTGLTSSSQTINTPWTISGSNIYNNNAGTVGIGGVAATQFGLVGSSNYYNINFGTALSSDPTIVNAGVGIFTTSGSGSGIYGTYGSLVLMGRYNSSGQGSVYIGANDVPTISVMENNNYVGIGPGTISPIGNLDVENSSNTATLCLNGNCASGVPIPGSTTVYPPAWNGGTPWATNAFGAPISCASTTTSCIQEAITYATTNHQNVHIVGCNDDAGTCVYQLTSCIQIPAVHQWQLKADNATYNWGSSPSCAIEFDSVDVGLVDWEGQIVFAGSGPYIVWFNPTNDAPTDGQIFITSSYFKFGSIVWNGSASAEIVAMEYQPNESGSLGILANSFIIAEVNMESNSNSGSAYMGTTAQTNLSGNYFQITTMHNYSGSNPTPIAALTGSGNFCIYKEGSNAFVQSTNC